VKRIAIAVAIVGAGGFGVYKYQDNQELKANVVARVERGKAKRLIIYNKDAFIKKKHGVQSLADATLKNIADGVKGEVVGSIPEINAYMIEAPADAVVSTAGGSWAVQEEKIYKAYPFQCSRCEPINCPGEGTPSPTPTPTPIQDSFIPWGVKAVKGVEAQAITQAKDVLVCVTDTGVDKTHPDLAAHIAGGKSFVPSAPDFQDDQGHGTHVAGTISAVAGNNKDAVGVSQAKIYAVKVLDRNGSGMSSWIASGVIECVRAGAKVINMSLGSDGPDDVIKRSVDYATQSGVVVVAAAGNNGRAVGYPAAYPNVVAVSAVDSRGGLASFSSRGPAVDYAAPGVDVQSLRLGGGTQTMSGTSMASPHVAGAFALAISRGRKTLKAVNLGLSPEQQGAGLIDALESVR